MCVMICDVTEDMFAWCQHGTIIQQLLPTHVATRPQITTHVLTAITTTMTMSSHDVQMNVRGEERGKGGEGGRGVQAMKKVARSKLTRHTPH